MTNKYSIIPHIIVLSFDEINNKNYILSEFDTKIEPLKFLIDDKAKNDSMTLAIELIQKHTKLSELDINIYLLDLHSKEIELYYKTNDTIYPLYGALVPYNENLSNGFWQEYSFLSPNPFSYSITRVAQNIVIL